MLKQSAGKLWILLLAIAPSITGCLGSMVYPVPGARVPSPPPAPYREVRLRTTTGDRVTAWEFEWKKRPVHGIRPVAIYLHGNGENVAMLHEAGVFESLQSLGIGFAAPDYPGYGRSRGTPSRKSLRAASAATLDYVRKRYPDRPIVVIGHSLGSAVTMQLAHERQRDIAGLILISPFTTLDDAAAVHFPRCLVWIAPLDNYDSKTIARSIKLPVLVLHGFRDRLIPPIQGKTLARAFAGPTEYIEFPNVGHNDIVNAKETLDRMREFMNAVSRKKLPVKPGAGLGEDD